MTPEQWRQVETGFAALNASPPEQRLAQLAAIPDEEVRAEIASLLEYDGTGETVGATVAAAASLAADEVVLAADEVVLAEEDVVRGRRIGPYRVIRRLGHGGQGVVFEAIRDDGSFQQRAAIKMLKWEADSAESRRRFRQERQILAGLQHPNIARLLDGGETFDGTPFLVMEFIEGQPLNTAAADWPLKRKLELFLQVANAVVFAHRNLVVHRDLKPANILVTADGAPKLLDFGIAKLMNPDATRTSTGLVGLTPDYASPEQVLGQPISAASDIYSLGVILYELLTGRRPYSLSAATPLEMDRVIVNQPPAPPGLDDELDHILLMALRKEPERRYPGVAQFAEDIQRYLDHRPILARPDTVWYRTRKYARRHWISLTAASFALVGVLGGAGVAVYQAQRAKREFNDVRQLANRFLFDFDAEAAKVPGNVKLREMIVSTALDYLNRLTSEASGDPNLQWELAQAFAKVAAVQGSTTQPSLRRPQDGIASFEKAFTLTRPLAGRNRLSAKQREDLIEMLTNAAVQHRSLKDYQGSLTLVREAVAQSNGIAPGWQARALGDLANTLLLMGDLNASLETVEQVVAVRRQMAEQDPSFVNRRNLATALYQLGEGRRALTLFDEAETAGNEALATYRALLQLAPGDPNVQRRTFLTLMLLGDLAGAGDAPSMGKYSDAADRYEEAIAAMDSLISADRNDRSSRSDVGEMHDKAASSLRDADPGRALAHTASAAQLLDAAAPQNTEFRAEPRIIEGEAHCSLHQFALAERSLREAETILKVRQGETEADLDLAWARLEIERGRPDAALDWYNRALEIDQQLFAKTPIPATAFRLARTLEFTAAAMPDSDSSYQKRVADIWADQNRRFPHRPWIEQRLASAQSHVVGQ